MRRLTAVVASATALTGGLIGFSIQPSGALSFFDPAVSLTGAQPVIEPGTDLVLTAQAINNGDIGWLSSTMTIHPAGKLDAGYSTEPSFANGTCSISQSTAVEDVVTCRYGTLLGRGTEPAVTLAVKTATTATGVVHSTASITAVPNVPATDSNPNNNAAAFDTTLVSGSGDGALTDGHSKTFTTAHGVKATFSVPPNGTKGGVVVVHIQERDTIASGITCAGAPCYQYAAEIDWQRIGGSEVTDDNPYTSTITTLKNLCAGIGGACPGPYYLPTGVFTGDATADPQCSTYSPNHGVPFLSADPCLYTASVNKNGAPTFGIAQRADQIIPISLPGSSGP